MAFLFTDTSGVWLKLQKKQGLTRIPTDLISPGHPCQAAGLIAFACQKQRECVCMTLRQLEPVSRMPCVPGLSSMCFSPCGRFLYQLSSEADCIHTRAAASGELLFAAPCGVFPRMMQMTSDGRRMLAAGGALGECYLFSLPELQRLRTIHTRHPCFAAGEWQEGLVLVCAAEGEDIRTMIYTLSCRALRPRQLTEFSGLPGTLCVCPDRVHALVSTGDGLIKLNLRTGMVVWNRPEWALCMRMECTGRSILISDTLSGEVSVIDQHHPWQKQILFSGKDAQACFLETM